MLSVVILFERSYPAMLLSKQLAHHWFVHSGPLVLGTAYLNFLHLQKIGTELSHDVLNPAHVPL